MTSRENIAEVREHYDFAFRMGDAKGVASIFAKDAIVFIKHHFAAPLVVLKGQQEIISYFELFFRQWRVIHAWHYTEGIEVILPGEVKGSDIGSGSMELQNKADSSGMTLSSQTEYYASLERESDGWKVKFLGVHPR